MNEITANFNLEQKPILQAEFNISTINEFQIDFELVEKRIVHTDTLGFLLNKTIKEYSNDTVTNLPQYLFYTSSIEKINCPNLTTIGNYCFRGSALKEINTEKIKSIGTYAFFGCTFTKLDFPVLTSCGTYAFENNKNLVSFSAPQLQTIPGNMLFRCDNLKEINVPNAKTISSSGFRGCGVSKIELPSAVTINEKAFNGNPYLKEIHIGENIKTINGNAFGSVGTAKTSQLNIYIDAEENSISGSPWGATASNQHIIWRS